MIEDIAIRVFGWSFTVPRTGKTGNPQPVGAEVSGEIDEAEKWLERLHANLDSLDATIRLFDPTVAPKAIKPRVKRTGRSRFRSVELTRTTLSILQQADRPLSIRAIDAQVAAECHLDMSTIAAANVVVANVRAALARPHEGLMSESAGRSQWSIGLIRVDSDGSAARPGRCLFS
jgi:hypothetical protein